jgi:hypothetical protein
MPTVKPELRSEPPRCDENHPRIRGVLRRRSDCPKCHRRDLWIKTVRRDQIKSGERVVQTRPGALRPIVPVRRCAPHPRQVVGCDACKAWSRYQQAVRRKEIRDGTLERNVPADLVAAHLAVLLNRETGGWFLYEIADRTGVPVRTLSDIVNGRHKVVYAVTWNAVKVLAPRNRKVPRDAAMVPATEVRRIIRGLAAQGWSFEHMAGLMGKANKSTANRFATETGEWVAPESVDEARRLRDKLGEYDLAVLGAPMPGMHRRCATHAARQGWVPLWAWAGRDIADPAATPCTFAAPQDMSAGPMPGVAFIDPMLRTRITAIAEKAEQTTSKRNKRAGAYIAPLRVTRLEAHAVTWYAMQAGMNGTQIAMLLGYPMRDLREVARGQRQINRLRVANEQARAWINSDPQGETPQWFAARSNAGRKNVTDLLPALMALQPEPYGAGWTVAELAVRCGVSEPDMRDLVADASKAADQIARLGRTG